MDTVLQTVNCVDVLPRTSRHLHSHLLWTSLEPGHCHCAVCLMEPHMNISKPSVDKSNTGVRTLISHHKRRTLVTLKILFFVEQVNAWDFHCAEWEHETHRKCVSLTRDAWDLTGCLRMTEGVRAPMRKGQGDQRASVNVAADQCDEPAASDDVYHTYARTVLTFVHSTWTAPNWPATSRPSYPTCQRHDLIGCSETRAVGARCSAHRCKKRLNKNFKNVKKNVKTWQK